MQHSILFFLRIYYRLNITENANVVQELNVNDFLYKEQFVEV